MWALPDCPEWTCPAPFLPGRRSTSGLGPFEPVVLPPVLLPSLPARLQPVPVAFSSLPAFPLCLPQLISFLSALLSAPSRFPSLRASLRQRRHVRPPSFYPPFCRSGRHLSPPATQAANVLS